MLYQISGLLLRIDNLAMGFAIPEPCDEITSWVAECLQIPVEKLRLFGIERDGNEVRSLTDRKVPKQSASRSREHEDHAT
jgi:hypothetical protein